MNTYFRAIVVTTSPDWGDQFEPIYRGDNFEDALASFMQAQHMHETFGLHKAGWLHVVENGETVQSITVFGEAEHEF